MNYFINYSVKNCNWKLGSLSLNPSTRAANIFVSVNLNKKEFCYLFKY